MVVALSLKEPPSSDALPGDAPRQIGLMSLKQISDVLLVHDDRVLLQQQLTVGLGYVKMVGTVVKTADGKVIGKVRDFEFSPDDGRIARLFDNAVNVLRTAQQYTAFAEPDDAGSRDDSGYVQWYLDHGAAYQQADPTRKLAVPSDIAIQKPRPDPRRRKQGTLPSAPTAFQQAQAAAAAVTSNQAHGSGASGVQSPAQQQNSSQSSYSGPMQTGQRYQPEPQQQGPQNVAAQRQPGASERQQPSYQGSSAVPAEQSFAPAWGARLPHDAS
ncbi:hypothetical protein WJX79_001780 [Trebouxia sp. C0005]